MKLAELRTCFENHGGSQYGGEDVTQLEHALQTALLAEQAGSDEALVVAALLHDVGHLLHDLPEDAPDQGIDDQHESSAARALQGLFAADVIEPVRMHVAAKRYMCAVDREYHDQLSEPSQLSLKLQGGPMSASEVAEFESAPHFRDAVQLRKWDDQAKIQDLETPSLDHYWCYVERACLDLD